MRQAIRVYAIAALVVVVALLAVWWTLPDGAAQNPSRMVVLDVVVEAQLWVLLVIPLGVLAASDAAHTHRRGWLAVFIVLVVLAPIAARVDSLAAGVQNLLSPSCPPGSCGPSTFAQSQLLYLPGWTAALLPVPIVAIIYTITPALGAPSTPAGTGSGERRVIVVCAVIGVVVMGALGFLVNTEFISTHFSSGTIEHIFFVGPLQSLLDGVWFMLLDALPIAVASLALERAVRAGQRRWQAGWIAVIVLAMLVANLVALAVTAGQAGSLQARALLDSYYPQMQIISAVVPVVVMLLALIYALTRRPEQQPQAAALAA